MCPFPPTERTHATHKRPREIKTITMSVKTLNARAETMGQTAALFMNINAAKGLLDVMKTNFGPKGTIKMLVSGSGGEREGGRESGRWRRRRPRAESARTNQTLTPQPTFFTPP